MKYDLNNKDIIFISSYARLPEGITAAELYKVVALGMLIDRRSAEIIDVDCSLITRPAKAILEALMKGKKISDIEDLEREIAERYFGSAKKAIISAVRKIHLKYHNLDGELDE